MYPDFFLYLVFTRFMDEKDIKNVWNVNKKLNFFINNNYRPIAYSILKNKYNFKIIEYRDNSISIINNNYNCHSIHDDKMNLIYLVKDVNNLYSRKENKKKLLKV